MLDLARLGLEVDSSNVRKASGDLDRFSQSGKKADGAAGGVTKSAATLATGMRRASVAIGAVVSALAAVSGSIRVLSSFERQMSTVGAVSRATAGELQAMRDIAADLGSTTEFTATQAGEGLEFLARAGFSASESISAIPAVLDLATAAAIGLGEAADISSNIMSAFGIAASEASSVADILAAASSRANTDVGQLGEAMAYVGPVASALGIEMSAAAAAIGVLSDAGIQGSSAGTGLRRVLSSLANPTKEAKDTLVALGLTMEELNPQTNDITEIVERLAGVSLSAADALTIFGDRGGPAILALTSQAGNLNELTRSLTGVEGEAARMADTMRDNLGGDIDGLVSSIQGLVIALGNAGLTAALRIAIQAITGMVRAASSAVDAVRSVFSAVNGFISSASDAEVASRNLETAMDNTSIATGDLILASRLLQRQIEDGNLTTIDAVRTQLDEARARREQIKLLEEERIARALNTQEYQNILTAAAKARAAMDVIAAPGTDVEQISLRSRAAFEEAEASLAAAVQRQMEFIELLRTGKTLTEEESQALDLIEANISALEAKAKKYNRELDNGVSLSERLKSITSSTNFNQATESARILAAQIGVALDEAVGLNRALNEAAGIQGPSPVGLRFSVGAPETPGGGFVGAGGQLRFGNLSGPDPRDFLPDRLSGVGGSASSGAASASDREAEAIERVIAGLREQIAMFGASEQARMTHQALQRAGVDLYSEEGQQIADLVEEYTALERAQKANEIVAGTLKDAILDFAENGTGAIEALTNAIKRMVYEAALFGEGPLGSLLGGAGGGGILGGITSGIAGLFGPGQTTGKGLTVNTPNLLPSFAGGGFTGMSSRSGGIDGRGGFAAVLHPNETVIDHTKGGGQVARPVVNNITVNAPPGSDVQEQRRQNSSGGEDLTIIIDRAVSNLARDPGSALSRTLGQNFGLWPATRGR